MTTAKSSAELGSTAPASPPTAPSPGSAPAVLGHPPLLVFLRVGDVLGPCARQCRGGHHVGVRDPALLRLDIANLIAASFRTSSVAWVAANTTLKCATASPRPRSGTGATARGGICGGALRGIGACWR